MVESREEHFLAKFYSQSLKVVQYLLYSPLRHYQTKIAKLRRTPCVAYTVLTLGGKRRLEWERVSKPFQERAGEEGVWQGVTDA